MTSTSSIKGSAVWNWIFGDCIYWMRARACACCKMPYAHTRVYSKGMACSFVPMNTVTRNSDAHTVGLGLIPLEYSPESLFILQDYFYVFVLDDEPTGDEICYSPFCICCFLPRVSASRHFCHGAIYTRWEPYEQQGASEPCPLKKSTNMQCSP
jgi:hypothetical protein